jgi:formylglycine-generating enzyme required for sulfatase activity
MPTASPAIASATHPTADPAANIAYPLWDGKETVPQYAKRAGIKETQLTLDLGNNVPMKLTLIPAGKFIMGSPKNEEGRQDRDYKGKADREGPQREVTITKPFYMGVYPVTQRQYEAILDRIPSRFFGPDNPVEQVYWDDAPEFCKTLSEKTGMEVALPTEAQWEYACRAGTTTRFYFGDDADYSKLGDYAWYTKNSEWKTHPVGLKKPNPWGLYDMYGNVEQQCADWYGNDYYKRTSNTDPTGPQSGEYRVMRGESWIAQAHECRSAGRGILYGGDGYLYGFRVIVKLK